MSVLTATGTPFPDHLAFDYTRTSSIRPSLPTGPAPPAPAARYTYGQPKKKGYTITTQQIQPALASNSHRHSRTISSSTLPSDPFHSSLNQAPSRFPAGPQRQSVATSHARQPSAASAMSMQRQSISASAVSGLPRRSTSSGSSATNGPSSYVALMRKQKATVWCDRAQSLDPRTAAQQKAARQRAHLEVQGPAHSSAGGRTSTINSGGVVGKIRHGGVPKAPGYVPANMSGAGVPMRLSANEMLGDEDEGSRNSMITGDNSMIHGRSGSGKSSTNSAKYRSGYPRPDAGRFSATSTPPSGEGSPSSGPDRIPEQDREQRDSFIVRDKQNSVDEDSFGELKDMSGPNAAARVAEQTKKSEDLRRRGSVDERAMSMGTGVKLFVANPDVNDD